MAPQEVLNYLKAEPFRPFRIRMASGRSYEIRHPEMIHVGRNTVIIYTSDNGLEWGEHRLEASKASPYEESLRVPLSGRSGRL